MKFPEELPPAAPGGAATTSPERWRRVQALLDHALDLEPAERGAYLDSACGEDDALRTEASRLLVACERAANGAGVFSRPAAEFAAPLLTDLESPATADREHASAELRQRVTAALSGRYTIGRVLGRGGSATVYLAHDIRHERAVAVKVLERSLDGSGAERFLREIRIAARLTHPHVLGVHDSGEADGLLYYVMPFVEGETLRARLARERALPLGDGVRLVRELADALAYAHARGVVHRDLKPENVLLSGGHAVVADFGIARALAAARGGGVAADIQLTSAGAPLGTPAYMAPEQATGDVADHRADLYALGIIAYEVLAGEHPFGARTRQALLNAHLTEKPVPVGERRPEVPPALAALVMRLLAKEPSARPQSAGAVLQVLDALPAKAGGRRLRAKPAVLAAAVLLVLVAAGGYTARREHPRPQATLVAASVRHTIAVLPFQNTGGAAQDNYFTDGLTDELAYALGRLPGVRLAGRTSSYAFRGRAATVQQIGRELGVAEIVTGTVQRAGDRLRVTAQLVGTSDGRVVWDSVYESRSGDVFALQDRLTRAMVNALAPALRVGGANVRIADASRGTADPEAYDLYLKGRYSFLQRGAANLNRAIGYFRQALARDPGFARAEAGLAMAYAELPPFLADPNDSATALAMAAARRAVALDSTLGDAQLALGFALDLQMRFREALTHYRAGVRLDPSSATGHHWLGFSLINLGRTDEGVREMLRATELDPLAASPASAAGFALLFQRRFGEAEAAARRSLALDPTFTFGTLTLGLAQTFGGRPDSAVQTLEGGLRLHPDDSRIASALVLAYGTAGRWADAARMRAELHRSGGDVSGGIDAGVAELVFGNATPLLRLLTSAAGQRRFVDEGGAFGCNPLLDPLWTDARFHAAMRGLTVEACPLARPWPITRVSTAAR